LTLAEDAVPGVSGVIVQRADKRVRCDNTLQRLFERRRHEMRLLIAQDLFEGKEL
jgi:vacuolar-type H+-ATPase subunit E/Vma4